MPRLFGVEVKPWMIWVGGGGAILLILLYLRSRGGAGGGAISAPQPDAGFGAGAGPSAPAMMGPIGEPGPSAFEKQLQDLVLQGEQQQLRQSGAMFELQKGALQQQISLEGRREAAYTGVYEAAGQLQETVLGKQREKAGKTGVKCPPGEHVINVPGEGLTCAPLGASKTSGRAITQRATGVVTDATEAYARSFLGQYQYTPKKSPATQAPSGLSGPEWEGVFG